MGGKRPRTSLALVHRVEDTASSSSSQGWAPPWLRLQVFEAKAHGKPWTWTTSPQPLGVAPASSGPGTPRAPSPPELQPLMHSGPPWHVPGRVALHQKI